MTGGAQGLGEGMAQPGRPPERPSWSPTCRRRPGREGRRVADELRRRRAMGSSTSTSPTTRTGSRRWRQRSTRQLGGLDIVVNNAGCRDHQPDRRPRRRPRSASSSRSTCWAPRWVIKHALPGDAARRRGRFNGGDGHQRRVGRGHDRLPRASRCTRPPSPGVDRLTRVAAMESGKLGYGVRVNCDLSGAGGGPRWGAGLANDCSAAGAVRVTGGRPSAPSSSSHRPVGSARSPTWPTPSCSSPPTRALRQRRRPAGRRRNGDVT